VWDTDGGVYFGYGTDRTEGAPPTSAPVIQYVGDRHLLSVGPTGSGINRRLLEPNVLGLRNWSLVIVDPNGELSALCARRRDPELQQTIFLNPFEVNGIPSHGFNPVAALDPASPEFPDDAGDIAAALIRDEDGGHGGLAAARDLLTALIMYSRLTQPNGGSLAHVRECLGQAPSRTLADALIAAGEAHGWPELSLKAAPFGRSAGGDLDRILLSALAQTSWIDSRPIRADLSGSTPIGFAMLKEVPAAVFLVLPARRLGSHTAWLRVVLAGIIQSLVRDGRAAKVPVMLMLDGYPAIARGGFPIVENNLAMLRACGVKLWTVWQDLAQLRSLYGDGFESFISSCGVVQSFAPQDLVTADYLSQRTGLTALELEARGRTPPGAPISQFQGGNVSYQPVPRMLPQDLRNMDEGFSVIFSHKVRNTIRAYLPIPSAPARRRSLLGGKGRALM
jgi:type IV secretion system protein VirD4